MRRKALLVPYNNKKNIYIQDRKGHKPPPWRFFGGSIEEGETPTQAVIRESKEELDIDIMESELIYLGQSDTTFDEVFVERYFFLYKTDKTNFTVLEGAGGKWVDFETAKTYLVSEDKVERLEEMIGVVL